MGLTEILSGRILPPVLFATGAWFTACVGTPLFGAALARPRAFWRRVREGSGRARPGRALAVALAGTLGVGNIAGVASALAVGGAGAVFWMWCAALVSMSLKYTEVTLALRTRRADGAGVWHGGAAYYIKDTFGLAGKIASALFAALCVAAALSLGGVVQTSAAAEACAVSFGLPRAAVGACIAVGTLAVLCGRGERTESVLAVLVPLMCAVFAGASFAVLFLRRAAIPSAFAAIFHGAFRTESALGGIGAFLGSRALRAGVSRGLVSNEAGCGTAPTAHAASDVRMPAVQGIFGMIEVFTDTILLCTLTALCLLVSGVPPVSGGGTAYALAAYAAVLGKPAASVLAVTVTTFAFATVLTWAHYGRENLAFLAGTRAARVFPLFAAASAFAGALAAPNFVWEATDLVLSFMTLLNLAALWRASRAVREETRLFLSTK